MLFLTEQKLERRLAEIKDTIHREVIDIPRFKFVEADPPGAERPDFDDSAWADFAVGDTWGGYDVVAWFRASVPVPPRFQGETVALRFLVGPRDGGGSTAETLLYVNGQPLQAIDVWHEEAWIPPELLAGGTLHLALKAWSGVLHVPDQRRFKVAQMIRTDENARRVYHALDVLHDAIRTLDADDWRREQFLTAANHALNLLDWAQPRSDAYYASVAAARAYLDDALAELHAMEPVESKPHVTAVGHSHIDMAWLWRLCHTREKASRTFATVLHLMRQYPEYRFMHSSPQLYAFLKRDYPAIFERVKARIASGEWEITGGMWIEPDTNLTGGESLIRQILLGRRFMRDEFGVEMTVLWLPDVFGYTWSLPQIARKSGLTTFITSKISWNQTNRFPYDTFYWRGIDGTDLLTVFLTTPEGSSRTHHTYNGAMTVPEVLGTWRNFRQKGLTTRLLLAYGWGDGGGGPTREMLETARAAANLPGFPRVSLGHVEPFAAGLAESLRDEDVPVWDGELYLEYHRGTYTSQARNKRANRRAETLYHDAEWACALADVLTGGADYPAGALHEGWEMILLNQFHDILPGSSIGPVYEDSQGDYARITAIGEAALADAQARIAGAIQAEGPGAVIFNSLAWPRADLVALPWDDALAGKTLRTADGRPAPAQEIAQGDGRALLVALGDLPAHGYAFYSLAERAADAPADDLIAAPDALENRFYRIELNDRGQIVGLFDKLNGRQALAGPGNVFQVFEDKPLNFDAWDIDPFYEEKMQAVDRLVEAEVEERGPVRAALRLTWQFYDSTITQRLTIYRDHPRIDFRTAIDWRQQQMLLKVAFPIAVRATKATYDIQFGNIERPTHRNTSWDAARFEVPAHKWVDLSEGDYGVALLNDCKYGHDAHHNVLRLTLLKSAIEPDAHADQGHHTFTYSLLPHAGTWREAEVARRAYELNVPPHSALIATPQPGGALPGRYTFAEVSADHVILETLKRAEDDPEAWVVRVYEYQQRRSDAATLTFGQPIRRAAACNLVEEEDAPAPFDGRRLTFAIAPYEIKTFKVWF